MAEVLLVMPAYNEEKSIEKVLQKIHSDGLDIVVIDDGSDDKTKEIVDRNNIKVISHPFNLGYGGALQTGFKYASKKNYEYVIQFDADGQHDPEDICHMIDELKKGQADIVIGSRFLGKGNFKAGFLKKVVIVFMRFLIKAFAKTNITDPTSGFKGLSKRTYLYYAAMGNFPSDYPDADVLIQMLRLHFKVTEIPINVVNRNNGTSMHSGLRPMIYLVKVLLSIMAILLRDKRSLEGE